MASNRKKVDVNELIIGMFVSKLDRPWLDTPYPIEGFYIKNDFDIRQLSEFCEYVYIDVDLTRLRIRENELYEAARRRAVQEKQLQQNRSGGPGSDADRTALHGTNHYVNQLPFEKEVATADRVYNELNDYTAKLLTDINANYQFNTQKINQVAVDMVESIIRNPDAFLWLSRLKTRDTYSYTRSIRSSIWAISFGRHLGLDRIELKDLSVAVLLSNIGKARLVSQLLKNDTHLSEVESHIYQTHVKLAVKMLKQMPLQMPRVIDTVAAHCERHDGSGYPLHLKGKQIPLLARIAGLVSHYEKLINNRDSRKSLDATRAMESLYKLRGNKFQAELVEEFIKSVGIHPAGSLIELNSREVAVILEQNEHQRLLPKVMILRDNNKQPVSDLKILDLETFSRNGQYYPKIINSVAIGSFGIDAEEIMESVNKVTAKSKSKLKLNLI